MAELKDLIRELNINNPIYAGDNREEKKIEITPYEERHADFFTHCHSKDNRNRLGRFVTKGWSPSIEAMKKRYGTDGYKESEEYIEAREARHQNTLRRNTNRYFFTILEDGRGIGYTSAIIKREDGHKFGRVSTMIGFEKDCGKGNATLALTKMLEILAEKTELEFYDAKVQPGNNSSLNMMRKVFGEGVEKARVFDVSFKETLDGKKKTMSVPRIYFRRPREYFLD